MGDFAGSQPLGEIPLHKLYEGLVAPIADQASKGAWYREWRLVSLDGTSLEPPIPRNREGFWAARGQSRLERFPQMRFAALVENGTHGCSPPAWVSTDG